MPARYIHMRSRSNSSRADSAGQVGTSEKLPELGRDPQGQARHASAQNRARRVSRHGITTQDLERLLQGLDLFLPLLDALLVADPRVHARGLQLVKVSHCGGELFLRALEIVLGSGERFLVVLLFDGL